MAYSADFERELAALLNKHSMENGSNTPDYMLANHLVRCLETYDATVRARETWYGRDNRGPPGGAGPVPVDPDVDSVVPTGADG